MGNATRRLKFLLFVICCGVFEGIRFVLEVGELHMNWDASDASPLDKLVCWFYPPRIFKEKTRQTKLETNGFRILSAIFAQQKPLLIQFGVQFHPFSKKMP